MPTAVGTADRQRTRSRDCASSSPPGRRGIGRAIVDLLHRRTAPASISATSPIRSSTISARAHPQPASARPTSPARPTSRACSTTSARSLGGLDALINNAGIAGPTGGVEEIAPADWRRSIDVDLTGQFLCAHHAVPMIKAAGGGAIVNMSSAAGRFGYAFRTPYSAAKLGVIGFTQSLAKELGPAQHPRQRHPARHRRGTAHERVIEARAGTARRQLRGDGEALSRARLAAPHGDARTTSRRSSLFLLSPAGRQYLRASRSASTAMSRHCDGGETGRPE